MMTPALIVLACLSAIFYAWIVRGRIQRGSDIVADFLGGRYKVVLYEGHQARVGNCKDCRHLTGYVSLWCTSKTARAAHGTGIPGRGDCKFWEEAERR